MFAPPTKPQIAPTPQKPQPPAVQRLEATGLLLIALLAVAIYVVRYWHHIPWRAR